MSECTVTLSTRSRNQTRLGGRTEKGLNAFATWVSATYPGRSMGPAGLERSKAQRNEDILSAAERVFTREGFAAATMETIAREAGVSKGGIYRHFSSKDELFLMVAARTAKHLEQLLRSGTAGESGFVSLKACIALTMSFAKEREGNVKLALDCSTIRDLVDPQSVALSAYDSAVGDLLELALNVLRRGQEDGSIRADVDIQRLMVSLWGAVVGGLQMTQSVSDWCSRLMLRVDTGGADMVDLIASSARP